MHVQKKLLFTSFALDFIGSLVANSFKGHPTGAHLGPESTSGGRAQCTNAVMEHILSWESKGTPQKPPPKKNSRLLRDVFFYHWFGLYSHDVLFKNFKHQIMQKINVDI